MVETPLDDEPNLYIENGWKSPFPSMEINGWPFGVRFGSRLWYACQRAAWAKMAKSSKHSWGPLVVKEFKRYLAILLVTFLGWLSDPFKGES